MTRPTINPHDPARGQAASTGSYHRGEPVWVFEQGVWQEGVVEGVAAYAVMVNYQVDGQRGDRPTLTDTLTAPYVMARDTSPESGGGGRA